MSEAVPVSRETRQERAWMDGESYSYLVDVTTAMLRKEIDAGRPYRLSHTGHRAGYMMKGQNVS